MPPPRLELDPRTLRLMLIAFALLSALTLHRLWFAEKPEEAGLLTLQGETMGTTYEIRITGRGLGSALRERVEKEVEQRLRDIDHWMSNWNPESDVSRFNDHASTEPFPVAYETAELVAYSVEVTKLTAAAFDITVGPLVALWGFGEGARIGAPPTQEEIDARLAAMGGRALRIGRGAPSRGGFLIKAVPEVEIDLSAIAKGYGADHVAGGLLELGLENFLVEIGGEIYVHGERPGGGPWRLAVEEPRENGRAIHSIVEVSNGALATSGDYRIFYDDAGERISHTIDPRTGRPRLGGPASATVLARSAAVADAWATALMVMGSEGLPLAEAEGLGAMLLWRENDGLFRVETNARFDVARARLGANPAGSSSEARAQDR